MENNNTPEQDDLNFLADEQINMPEEIVEEPEFTVSADVFEEASVIQEIAETVHNEMQEQSAHAEEIIADEPSMAWHDTANPIEPEQPFDLDVLNDSELDAENDVIYDNELSDIPSVTAEEIPDSQDPVVCYEDSAEFDEVFHAPVQEEAVPVHDRPVRKGRPKKKRGELFFTIPHLAVTAVWLALILVIGVTLGRMLWVCAADVLAFGRESKEVTVTVYESDTIDDITEKLHNAGLVRYPGLFKLYASLAVDEGEIAPGIWDLNTLYDYHALVNMMSPRSNREVIQVMIPEGYTCRQIFALLEEKKVCTAVDIAAYASNGELSEYWFLDAIERGSENCLEGFLFPDTYEFYKNSSSREALEKMLDNFEYRFTEEMRSQIDILNANVTNGTFDIHDVVIVASLIEKETASNDESPMIASVIYNRLFDWGGTPAYLNIDAAIVYALNGKTDLTAEDLKVDSPYNTYLYTGLTPGAISNPGLSSLKAALNPATSNYYFYVLDPAQGAHHFTTTYNEHQAFIASLE